MAKPVFLIVDNFYNASWDLACNLLRLYEHAGENNSDHVQQTVLDTDKHLPLTIPSILEQFRKYAHPFLDLQGADLPHEQHLPYMQIEDSLKETVFPGLDVLCEHWQALHDGSPERLHANEPDQFTLFRQSCSYLRIEIENTIITNTSFKVHDMKPTV